MSVLYELGQAVRVRRGEMGLSQARVAVLSGLSRQTINQIETGVAPDLGLNKAERLASVLGLRLRVDGGTSGNEKRHSMAPVVRAAATASTSYKVRMTGAMLKKILLTGQTPQKYVPHVHALLDDAPVSLLAAVVDQISRENDIDRSLIWSGCRGLARVVKSRRELWG